MQLSSKGKTRRQLRALMFAIALAVVLMSAIAVPPVFAAKVQLIIKPGPLTADFPLAPILSPIEMSGFDRTATGTLGLFDMRDARGNGAGWNLVLCASDFINQDDPAGIIPSSAFVVTPAPPVILIAGNTPPQSFGGSLAPSLKILTAATNTGMGRFQVEPLVNLAIPADTLAGTYDSTLTLTLATGP
jgi:hypothetical protein